MFERFTPTARNVLQKAVDAARELHHPWVGTEHLLLGMTDPGSGATAEILREAALDRDRVVAEIDRLCDQPPSHRNEADAEALRSIGIDLDAMIAAVERSFGPGALAAALCTEPAPRRLPLRVRLRRLRPTYLRRRLVRRRNRRRDARLGAGVADALPMVPRAKIVLELSLRESLRLHHDNVGSEHILLGLLRDGGGLGTQILVHAGLTIADLRERTLRSLGKAA